MQQGLYAKHLDDKINHLHKCGADLKGYAEYCDKERTNEVFLIAQRTYEILLNVQTEVRRTGSQTLMAIEERSTSIEHYLDDSLAATEGVSFEVARYGSEGLAAIAVVSDDVRRIGAGFDASMRYIVESQAAMVRNIVVELQRDWEFVAQAKAAAMIQEARAEAESELLKSTPECSHY